MASYLRIFGFSGQVLARRRLPPKRAWVWLGALLVPLIVFVLAPWPLLDKLWAIGYGICPQRVSHSYFLAGRQLPVEAREGGMFAGFLLSVLVFAALGRFRARELPSLPLLVLLLLFGAGMAFDGVNNTLYDMGLFHLYAPYNPARLVTGLLMGATMAGLLWPVFNMTLWHRPLAAPVLDRGWQLGLVLLALALFAALILLGVDWLLYPASLIITAGQVMVLTTLGAIAAAIILRRDGRAVSAWDLLPLIVAGLGFTALLLGATSALRYALLGTAVLP
jgi:uncharacterized membrane protein